MVNLHTTLAIRAIQRRDDHILSVYAPSITVFLSHDIRKEIFIIEKAVGSAITLVDLTVQYNDDLLQGLSSGHVSPGK
jgi:hypothetical protein